MANTPTIARIDIFLNLCCANDFSCRCPVHLMQVRPMCDPFIAIISYYIHLKITTWVSPNFADLVKIVKRRTLINHLKL